MSEAYNLELKVPAPTGIDKA